jgi:hypothetical protein
MRDAARRVERPGPRSGSGGEGSAPTDPALPSDRPGAGTPAWSSPTLRVLLEAADTAGPHERIQYRDPIARHGLAAIEAMTPWLVDRRLGAFAVRVITRVGENGDRDHAITVLRRSRTKAPPYVQADINAALRRLLPPSKS